MKVICEMADECHRDGCEHNKPHNEIIANYETRETCRFLAEHCSEVDRRLICVPACESQAKKIVDDLFEGLCSCI